MKCKLKRTFQRFEDTLKAQVKKMGGAKFKVASILQIKGLSNVCVQMTKKLQKLTKKIKSLH